MPDKRTSGFAWSLVIIMMITIGCTSNYYITAYNLQQRGNYVGAIENYDQFIRKSNDGAMIVNALNGRSESYYQLGLQSMNRGNYPLAIRMFYLANSSLADERIADCYLILADNAYQRNDIENSFRLYDYVITSFPESARIVEALYRRILLNHENQQDGETILEDYILLVEKDQEGNLVRETNSIINQYIPSYITEAKIDVDNQTAINQLLKLLDFPHSYHDLVKKEIGSLYLALGDDFRINEQFRDAEKKYSLALEYDPSLQIEINDRLSRTVDQMVARGDMLLRERKIDEAIDLYNRTFNIMPDNQAGRSAIARANELRENIRQAEILYNQGLEMERENRYREALRLYQQSYNRDRLTRASDKIFLMTNLIEIENDPETFAISVISNYKNGLIIRNLNEITNELLAIHGDDVNVSGWRIMLSTGTHRYEIRYDITSRTDSYYFIWQVNLLNRQLTPLNRISGTVMEG